MTEVRRAYSSTVVAPGQIAVSVALAVAFWAVTALLPGTDWPAGAGAAAVIALAGIHQATVRLMVSPDRIRIGQGPWGRPGRSIMTAAVRDAHGEQFSRTTRLTVRPGPALVLVLSDGEYIRVSTPDPAAAAQLIDRDGLTTGTSAAGGNVREHRARQREGMAMTASERPPAGNGNRPWFGPKRVGWGLRPQTWPGWVITLAPALIAIVVIMVVR
jgi:hypothetical protein